MKTCSSSCFVMAPSSQELEPPANPGVRTSRFSRFVSQVASGRIMGAENQLLWEPIVTVAFGGAVFRTAACLVRHRRILQSKLGRGQSRRPARRTPVEGLTNFICN